jgi:hypothetical protein
MAKSKYAMHLNSRITNLVEKRRKLILRRNKAEEKLSSIIRQIFTIQDTLDTLRLIPKIPGSYIAETEWGNDAARS